MPYLAAAYVLGHLSRSFFEDFVELKIGLMMGDTSEEFAALGREIHAISCASKPLVSWTARDAIQESRECCGGHGFFAGSLFWCLYSYSRYGLFTVYIVFVLYNVYYLYVVYSL